MTSALDSFIIATDRPRSAALWMDRLAMALPSDMEFALAFIANRQGKDAMPRAEWRSVVAMELGWLTPEQARRFVDAAVTEEWLSEEEDVLRLTFDRRAVVVPRGFRLDASALAATTASVPSPASPDPFLDLIDSIAKARDADRTLILAEVHDLQQRFGGRLTADAAAVRIAADAGLDVQTDAETALERIRSTAAPG